jgi:hypothetical protein
VKFKLFFIQVIITFISMDLAHFDAAAFVWPARRPMVVVRLRNTGYRGFKGVVKFLGPTAVGKVARRGAPQNGRAAIAFSTTVLFI